MSKRQSEAETKTFNNEIIGIGFIALAVLVALSIAGFSLGSLGLYFNKFLVYALGKGSFLLVLFLAAAGIKSIFYDGQKIFSGQFIAFTIFCFNLLLVFHQYIAPYKQELLPEILPQGGGIASAIVIFALRKILGLEGTWVLLVASLLSLAVITFRLSIKTTVQTAGKTVVEAKNVVVNTHRHIKDSSFFNYEKVWGNGNDDVDTPSHDFAEEETFEHARGDYRKPSFEEPPRISSERKKRLKDEIEPLEVVFTENGGYQLPPLALLNQPKKAKGKDSDNESIEQAHILEQTLSDFKVNARIVNVVNGPSVTRFEVEPAPGVKVNKITGLIEDLTLRLKVSGIRIETSIPGKSAMGIEVPKKSASAVLFYDVVSDKTFKDASSKLSVALGKDITGKTIVSDISKMPHMLVAGSTGSGKSVCINTLVNSILFKATPDEVKFIMIDPKVVELSTYNGIPHLLVPVVTNPKKAASALFWAVEEMERRYSLFAENGVREIGRYNTISKEKIPYVVIIIDELADLMMAAPADVEDAICRLAQKARAAGLHLILATQRPSVDVITGIIKANIPSRIAFAVSSQIDSRTILDSGGAEKLLGKGDMLYYPVGMNKPLRLQGAFISDDEIETITDFIKNQSVPVEYTESVTEYTLPSDKKKESSGGTQNEHDMFQDDLLPQALDVIMQTNQASASMLQRRLRIGYTRAARIVDILEEHGIVGPSTGTSKPRDIMMNHDEALDVLGIYDNSHEEPEE